MPAVMPDSLVRFSKLTLTEIRHYNQAGDLMFLFFKYKYIIYVVFQILEYLLLIHNSQKMRQFLAISFERDNEYNVHKMVSMNGSLT